ncbi:helix-turn-helix domain-containing protein [Jiangella anatolica]|uniref:AraC family transcriptional regulator n=1 Tax=Jiangella anatolica TaxID=2670374 RepID=A0A2W2BW23_9ACTN|nr:helix-turn-helix domain-containing protein [Jiangella anatolica]PZF84138.1 AraC family transcriptional regulator [Jiangella anatolica]
MTGEDFPAPAADAQSHVERAPAPALRDLASSIWVQQIGRDAEPYPHRRIPNGAVDLVCRVGSAPQVVGPLTDPLVETLQPGTTVVGVRLVPGAFPALAGRPASEVAGLVVDAEDLWGRSAAALGEAVGTAASPREALAAMQRHVHERAGAGRPHDPLVHEAVRGLLPWRSAGVTSLSTSLGISETQLRRRFRTAVGLAPKALHRMLRFQRFLALAQKAIGQGRAPTGDSLAALALRVGYADQSHLTRECVRLTGVSPRVFLAETQRTCACGHDHSASFMPVLRAETAV